MNKKILSCALVAAMLASSVGAMGVSAANKDAFDNSYTGVKDIHENLATAVNNGIAVDEISTVPFVDDLEEGTASKTKIYLENYAPADDTMGVEFDDVLAAIEDAEGKETTTQEFKDAVKALSNYFLGKNPAGEGTLETVALETETGHGISDNRSDAIDVWEDNFKDIDDNFDASYYDATELAEYGIFHEKDENDTTVGKPGDLIFEINNVDESINITKTVTTRIMYLNYEYERLLGEDGLVAQSTSKEDAYEELLEKAENLTEDDYTASNWVKVQKQIELAEIEAAAGTAKGYNEAIKQLNVIFEEIETVKPTYSDLKDALLGLYNKDADLDKDMADGIYGDDKSIDYQYDKADYKYGGGYSDAWYEFAGKAKTKDEDAIEGAVKKAYDVYELCTRSSTRKYVAQSTVDKVLEELNDAIFALDPNYETSNWVIVMLEDALEVANNVVEDDFRTTSSYWKNFVKDKEYIEKLLEQDSVKEKVAKAAVEALLGDDMDATKGKDGSLAELSNCKLAVSTATKNALKDAIKEAKDLLEDKTGKTSSQIVTLQNALDDAEEIGTKNTISEYENATATLEDAMTNYEHPQGWYQDNNGTWFYGKEGDVAKGWLNVNGVWYLLDSETGAMKTGWQQVNGTWYYMNASGAMQTGWLNLNGTYYYLESWGGMATGWKSVNGSWYYLQPSSGAMVANGWYWINGKCYYFYNWGGMAANTTIDGYTVDASGAWVK